MLNANGTEANQSKATIIVFDDAFHQLPWPGGNAMGVNTTDGAPYVQPKTLNVFINFTSPVDRSVLGMAPFNPFIYVDRVRSKEVHLLHQQPTDLADKALLGTQDDKSLPSSGKYYVTGNNLPFAIDIISPFDYAAEKKKISQAHLKFCDWARSSGQLFADWYKPVSGYRNASNIYSK